MAYTRVNWENLPSTATPRNATNLNVMDAGIDDVDARLTTAEEVIGNETDTYSASSTYALGSLVIYGGLLYKCTTAIIVAEAWNGAKWTQIDLVNVSSGLKGKILWTNPNPTSAFAGQTVTLSETIANYDSYEVIYIGDAYLNKAYMTTGRIPKRVSQLTYNYYFNARREITSISGTSIVFGNGAYFGAYGSDTISTSNVIAVPWIIIGYKTGLFS